MDHQEKYGTSQKQCIEEFKKEVIHLLETSGKKKGEIARDLGMTHRLLHKWQKRFRVNLVNDELELSEVEEVKAELHRTKRGLEITRMEGAILKQLSQWLLA